MLSGLTRYTKIIIKAAERNFWEMIDMILALMVVMI